MMKTLVENPLIALITISVNAFSQQLGVKAGTSDPGFGFRAGNSYTTSMVPSAGNTLRLLSIVKEASDEYHQVASFSLTFQF